MVAIENGRGYILCVEWRTNNQHQYLLSVVWIYQEVSNNFLSLFLFLLHVFSPDCIDMFKTKADLY